MEPGIKHSHMSQILHMFCDIWDTCQGPVACRMSETNTRTMVVYSAGHDFWYWSYPAQTQIESSSVNNLLQTSISCHFDSYGRKEHHNI